MQSVPETAWQRLPSFLITLEINHVTNHFFRVVILLALLLFGQTSWAASVLVAVAANFSKPMTEIAAEFEKATGHSAKLSFGSSGKFVSQIENGGPFEVLLSADEKTPQKLGNPVWLSPTVDLPTQWVSWYYGRQNRVMLMTRAKSWQGRF